MEVMTRSISAIWLKDERLSPSECSKVVLNFLTKLKEINPNYFQEWYLKGMSKNQALCNKLEFTDDFMKQEIEKNWDKKFEDLGSRISYWNGGEVESSSYSISFNIGAFGNKSFNKNSCVISLPQNPENDLDKKVLNVMREFWKPDKMLINGEQID